MPSASCVQSAETYRKEGRPLFPGAWEKRRLLCSASREKKGACVNSRHTRSQIEDNHQRATGRVDVPCPRTTSAIRIEQEGLFCSVLSAFEIEQNKNFVQSSGGKTGFFPKLWYNERVAVRAAARRSGLAFLRLCVAIVSKWRTALPRKPPHTQHTVRST